MKNTKNAACHLLHPFVYTKAVTNTLKRRHESKT